jgi:hypothetical protein
VFVPAVAPFTPLHSSSVSCIVARAARRAGLGTIHGHRLGHTAATETLNAGAGLEEVAQLMRHAGGGHQGHLRQDRPEPAQRPGPPLAERGRCRMPPRTVTLPPLRELVATTCGCVERWVRPHDLRARYPVVFSPISG